MGDPKGYQPERLMWAPGSDRHWSWEGVAGVIRAHSRDPGLQIWGTQEAPSPEHKLGSQMLT